MLTLSEVPIVKAEMLIRKPVEEVFEAFVDPAITTQFWILQEQRKIGSGQAGSVGVGDVWSLG